MDMDPYVYFENDHAVEQPTGKTDGIREQRGIYWRRWRIADMRRVRC